MSLDFSKGKTNCPKRTQMWGSTLVVLLWHNFILPPPFSNFAFVFFDLLLDGARKETVLAIISFLHNAPSLMCHFLGHGSGNAKESATKMVEKFWRKFCKSTFYF